MATATDDNAEIRNLDARLFGEINLLAPKTTKEGRGKQIVDIIQVIHTGVEGGNGG